MNLTTTDHDAALDKLTADTFHVGAQRGVLESIKLLGCLGMLDAAEALHRHHESIEKRAQTFLVAEDAIRKARAG